MKQRLKAWFCLLSSIPLVLTLIFSSIPQPVSAASNNQGSLKTAKQKLVYEVFKNCYKGAAGVSIKASEVGRSFGQFSRLSALSNVFDDNSYVHKLIGKTGITNCHDIAQKLNEVSLSTLELSTQDILCDTTNYYGKGPSVAGGVIVRADSAVSCTHQTKDGNLSLKFDNKDEIEKYLDHLITTKTFGGDVPGGSLDTLTPIEKYFVEKLSFESSCIDSGERYDEANVATYSMQVYNDSTGEFEIQHYGKTGAREATGLNETIYSCDELSRSLTSGETFQNYKAALEGLKSNAASAKAECEAKLAAGEISEAEAETCIENADEEYKEAMSEDVDIYNMTSDTATEDEIACYNAASSLGWIICPVLNGLTSAMEGLYNKFVVPALSLESKFVSSDSGTYKAWSMFRDFANIIFVIFFLIIIISQLTGYGIDNYGIKKSLPKLIVAALIVNLSFIICQLSVDVSNIVGSSLGELLKSTAIKIGIPDSLSSNLASGRSFAAGLGALGVIAVAGLAMIVANGGVGAALLAMFVPLLMGILSAVIALLFMFFLLALRKSLTIILIVISPVAFVCYTLPNTKNLFDKWLKAIEGMLLLYPICSMVIGGGLLASNIILSTGEGNNNFFIALTGMLAQVMPYFFVPTLLRSSFKATGAIGAKIGGVGRRVSSFARRGAGNSIRSSDAFKSRQQRLVDASKINKFRRQKTRIENKRIKEGTRASYLGALAPNATKEERREATRRADEESKRLREYNKAQSNIYASEAKGQTATQSQQDKLAHALHGKDSEDVTNRINEVASNATINASQARILAGANAGLANARGEAIKTNDMAKSGTFERIAAAQDERRNKEKDEETRANLRTQTRNFDLSETTTLLSQLVHSDKDPKTDPNLASMIRVLTQALAATGPGKGELAKIAIDENSKPEMRRFLAGEIQNDPSLAASVKSKDAYALRYMSDINSGAIGKNTKFEEWLTSERVEIKGGILARTGESNQSFVLRQDLSDDADLAKLSRSALIRATSGMNTERLQTIVNARDYHSLFSDSDRRGIIEDALRSKGGTVPGHSAGTPPTPPPTS